MIDQLSALREHVDQEPLRRPRPLDAVIAGARRRRKRRAAIGAFSVVLLVLVPVIGAVAVQRSSTNHVANDGSGAEEPTGESDVVTGEGRVVNSEAGALTAVLPPGWNVLGSPLTDRAEQREVFAVGTMPAAEGVDPACPILPTTALRVMQPSDTLVVIFELGLNVGQIREPVTELPNFLLRGPGFECLPATAVPMLDPVGRWTRFQEQGRTIQILVYFGANAQAERADEVLAIINSLELRPR